MMKSLLSLLIFLSAQQIQSQDTPLDMGEQYLERYRQAMIGNPIPGNQQAVNYLIIARSVLEPAAGDEEFMGLSRSHSLLARTYSYMLNHPRGNERIDTLRYSLTGPLYLSLIKAETVEQPIVYGPTSLSMAWEGLVAQCYVLGIDAYEKSRYREGIAQMVQGALAVNYLKRTGRGKRHERMDKAYEDLLGLAMSNLIDNKHLQHLGSLVPRAGEWYPQNMVIWVAITNYYILKDEHEKALEAIRYTLPLIEAHPDLKRQLYYNAGNMLHNKPEEAISWYRKALEIDPDYYGAQYNLGVSLITVGRAKGAEAESLRRKDRSAYQKLFDEATALYGEGAAHLEEAYRISPSDTLRQTIRSLYTQLGNKAKAEEYSD